MDNVRYTVPSKFEHAPYGTRVKVIDEHDQIKSWIQLNNDPEGNALWVSMGDFLVGKFSTYLDDEKFMNHLLKCHGIDLGFVDLKELVKKP